MKISGAIFDLDGTLLDSMPMWQNIGINYLKSIGKTPRADICEVLRPVSLQQAAEYLIADYDVSYSVEQIIDDVKKLIAHYYTDIMPVKPGVKECLARLQQNGTKMCVATASDHWLVEAALRRNRVLDYFQFIFTCDELGCGKDNPLIFNRAWQSLKTKKQETYVFEDSLFAVKTAKAAGFNVIGVFDQASADQRQEIAELADLFINSYDEMTKHI